MLRHLLRVTLRGAVEGGEKALLSARGAVEGGEKALLSALPVGWLEPIVLLDSAVKSPAYGTKAAWWKRCLYGVVPLRVFNVAFFELLGRQKYKRDVGGLKPAYAYSGTGKSAGLRCIDDELSESAGSSPLPRMVRTADGRELLQQQLIKEREEQDAASTS